MSLVFTLSKIMTLLGCGWSAPCAIAFTAGELLEWFRGLWTKKFFSGHLIDQAQIKICHAQPTRTIGVRAPTVEDPGTAGPKRPTSRPFQLGRFRPAWKNGYGTGQPYHRLRP